MNAQTMALIGNLVRGFGNMDQMCHCINKLMEIIYKSMLERGISFLQDYNFKGSNGHWVVKPGNGKADNGVVIIGYYHNGHLIYSTQIVDKKGVVSHELIQFVYEDLAILLDGILEVCPALKEGFKPFLSASEVKMPPLCASA